MKADEDLVDINNKIHKLIIDEELTYMEAFAVLESVKSYFVGQLIKENMNITLIPVKIKR